MKKNYLYHLLLIFILILIFSILMILSYHKKTKEGNNNTIITKTTTSQQTTTTYVNTTTKRKQTTTTYVNTTTKRKQTTTTKKLTYSYTAKTTRTTKKFINSTSPTTTTSKVHYYFNKGKVDGIGDEFILGYSPNTYICRVDSFNYDFFIDEFDFLYINYVIKMTKTSGPTSGYTGSCSADINFYDEVGVKLIGRVSFISINNIGSSGTDSISKYYIGDAKYINGHTIDVKIKKIGS